MQFISHAPRLGEKFPHRKSALAAQHGGNLGKKRVAHPDKILGDLLRIYTPSAESAAEASLRREESGTRTIVAVFDD